jgi:hypothetical protein
MITLRIEAALRIWAMVPPPRRDERCWRSAAHAFSSAGRTIAALANGRAGGLSGMVSQL